MDMSLNGNHVLTCPKCGHQHCQVVVDGKITEDRWQSRNMNVIYVSPTSVTTSGISTYTTYSTVTSTVTTTSSGTYFLYNSWMNGTRVAT